jgi:hypothetical protein
LKEMSSQKHKKITDVVGNLPYRIALSGGWIDQPYVSRHNPSAPGSMVVVAVEPEFRFMDRSGICGSTREIALKLWNNRLPDKPPEELVQELYKVENEGKTEPSGSQDMIGIIYPGINRLDYDVNVHGGIFPAHIESNSDPDVASWLGEVIQIVPVGPRPDGYNPLGRKNFSPEWIARLGQSGKDCYEAIINKNLEVLGAAFNECMLCWHNILPDIVEHPILKIDLLALLEYYQSRYSGAMYSGCGGGYLYVASSEPVPGSFRIKVRIKNT